MPLDQLMIDTTVKCLKSFQGKVNRIILVQNGIKEAVPEELIDMADSFIQEPFNILMAGAINQGYLESLDYPDTEFLCFANNDTENDNVNWDHLCAKGEMTSPIIGNNQKATYGAHASCFIIHKDDFAKVGYWNLCFATAADEQWFKRCLEVGIQLRQVPSQHIHHNHPALTNNEAANHNV